MEAVEGVDLIIPTEMVVPVEQVAGEMVEMVEVIHQIQPEMELLILEEAVAHQLQLHQELQVGLVVQV